MVTIFLPATAPTLVMQDLVGDAVDQHGAGGALAFAAAVLGAGEVQIVAQDAEKRAVGIGIDSPRGSVHMETGDSGHLPLCYSSGARAALGRRGKRALAHRISVISRNVTTPLPPWCCTAM